MTDRALIVTAAPVWDSRLTQVHGIYAALGMSVDLLVLSGGGEGLRIPPQIGRFASVPDRNALPEMVQTLTRDHPMNLIHEDRWSGPTGLDRAAHIIILDIGSEAPPNDPGQPAPTLTLTTSETMRQHLADRGAQALRLPGRLAEPATMRRRRSGLMGWWGAWDAPLADAWRHLLREMTSQGVAPPNQLLLAGPGADRVALPGTPMHVIRRPRADASCLRVVDLAVLPLSEAHHRTSEILAAISRGAPVVGLSQAMAGFEDRWRLPAASSLADLAQLVGTVCPPWPDIPPDHNLDALTSETQAAMLRDQVLMEGYVTARIARFRQMQPS